jgi:hypothetical protein
MLEDCPAQGRLSKPRRHCGTCLECYELEDKLKVGMVTNMYDTVGPLLSSGKVIRI